MSNLMILFQCKQILTLFTINVCIIYGFSDKTLTTALVKEFTSPKPTTIFRRINVDPDAFKSSNKSLHLIRVDSRRHDKVKRTEIWNWDEWCQLQPKRGNCGGNFTKYYYSVQLDECSTFTYSGCNSNRNNFDTKEDCNRQCKGASFMVQTDTRRPVYCYLQPDTGLCLALIQMYYFDINEKTCKKFFFGGCGGNLNKFESLFSCTSACGSVAV